MNSSAFSFKGTSKKFFIGLALCLGGSALTYIEQYVPLFSEGIFWLIEKYLPFVMNFAGEADVLGYVALIINTQVIAAVRNWIRSF